MSVEITTVTIGAETDRRLTLGNAHWAAKLNIGSTWTALRIGCRVAFDDFGASIPSIPRFYLGALADPTSGLANGPLNNATSHFIGMRSKGNPWNRVIGASSYYSWSTNAFYAKKVGSVVTEGTGGLSDSFACSILPASNRNAVVVELTKLSSISTKVAIVVNTDSANNTGDLTSAQLRTVMEQATMAGVASMLDTLTGQGHGGGSASSTIATDEAVDGYWNSICVGWDRSTPLCYISDMFFAKIA
jgi:hypothetical protein